MRITVTGGKGGTGKSMVTTSIAVMLAKQKKVMLIDADAECPNDYLILNIKNKELSKVYQLIPKWDYSKCIQCGKCAMACKQEAIIFVKGKNPAFIKESCTGCGACINTCPTRAISESRKEIGTVYIGNNYNVKLITGELKLSEPASGEVVTELIRQASKVNDEYKADITIIDSAAGIGCPVIASITGSDYVIAVTEPTPSGLHDLKRVLYLAEHFKIKQGIVINKYDLEEEFCNKIKEYAKENNIPIIGEIPFKKQFIDAAIKMKPITELKPEYRKYFKTIIKQINQFQ